MTYIDLTLPLNVNTPVYPGDPKIAVEQKAFLDKDMCVMHALSLGSHSGTHIDAPLHMIADGKSINQFPPETFFGNGVCIDVRNGYTLSEIMKHELKENDIVFLCTGWDKKIGTPDYYEKFPPIPEEICRYFVTKRVKIVGTDSPSADDVPFTSHKLLLENNILIIESLIHVDSLIGKSFSVSALPLNLEIDGAPIRVVASLL